MDVDNDESTIQAALDSLNGLEAQTIFIYPGNYSEQVTISYEGNLTIYGYTTKYALVI